jgi:hypothetical protein
MDACKRTKALNLNGHYQLQYYQEITLLILSPPLDKLATYFLPRFAMETCRP